MTPRLSAAIAKLYPAFAGIRLAAIMEGCPCCASAAELARLSSTPIRELGPDTLAAYSWHAIWTVGTEADYRHFVPRLLELMIEDGGFQPEVVAKKLRLAGWTSWSKGEQEAIEEYFHVLWEFVLEHPSWCMTADDTLCVIGNAVDDLSPFLSKWVASNSVSAIQQLVQFANAEASYAAKGLITQAFWADCPEQMKQVADWLTAPATLKALENRWLSSPEGPLADALLEAVEWIELNVRTE